VRSLSSLLSYLDPPESIADAAVGSARRSLSLPLFRHWALALAVLRDVAALLRRGRGAVLLALLRCRQLLQRSDDGYLLNRVWLDDYCVWLQQLPPPQLAALAEEVRLVALQKADVGWPLAEYEALAREEEEDGMEQDDGGTLV
jgi:protein SHQ1